MTPSDLPTGLRSRQCLDLSEMTFLDTLKHHIEKIVHPAKEEPVSAPSTTVSAPTPPPKKKKWPIVAVIAFVLAASITLGVVIPNLFNFLLSKKKKQENFTRWLSQRWMFIFLPIHCYSESLENFF